LGAFTAGLRSTLRRAFASFGVRLFVLFAFATLAPLAVSLAQIHGATVDAEENAYGNARLAARMATSSLQSTIEDASQAAQTIENLPSFWDGTDADRSTTLAALASSRPTYNAFFYFTGDYQVHGSSAPLGDAASSNLTEREYAREAITTGQATFGHQAVVGRDSGRVNLPVVVPMREAAPPGRSGYLAAMLSFDRLPQVWADVPMPPGSTMLLIDTQERRILGGTGEVVRAVNDILPPSQFDAVRADERTYRLVAPHDNVERLRAWEPIAGTPWIVAADTPVPAVFGPIYAAAARRAALTAGITALACLLLLLLWHQMGSRLRALQVAAGHWSERDWTYRAGLRGQDELSQLGSAFDGMAAQLEASEAERARAEESRAHLAAIVAASQDAIISTTVDGRILSWNAGAEQLYGYSAAEALGQPIAMIVPPEERAELGPTWERVCRGERVGQYETVRLTRDGIPIEVELSLAAVQDTQGRVIGIAAITRDITERRRAEAELREAKEAAEVGARAKAQFLANMSHEIRTPMNGVIGMTGLLLDTPLTPTQHDFATTIRHSADALLTIINDILDFSKVEAGQLVLETTDFDVSQVVEEVADLLAAAAQRKGLELLTHVAPEVPRGLRGDPGRLRQILTNLLGNAVKFTERGEVVLRAELASEDAVGVVVRFAVCDTGIGIPQEARERVFEAFAQADGSTARRYGGTGLGLAISRRLVELMGGAIGVESEVGQGSTFWFTARLERGAARPDELPARADLRGLRVLIVDDNATNRTILEHQLTNWGMVSGTAADGPQALARLRAAAAEAQPYELAILDMQMPEMDGLALARAIKGDPALADIHLVLLTSLGQHGPGADALTAGIAASLTKPVRQSQLYDALANVTGTPADGGARPAPAPAPKAAPALVSSAGNGPRLLVAEDNPVNQKVAIRILEKLGYQADVVGNGLEVLDALDRIPYPLVLMDCQMPEMDGFAATAAIRARENGGQHTPIIAMTAGAMQGDRERCLAAGMDDYISKPVRPEQLGALLARWLPREPAADEAGAGKEGGAAGAEAPGGQAASSAAARDAGAGGQAAAGAGAAAGIAGSEDAAEEAEPSVDTNVLAQLGDPARGGDPAFLAELIALFRDEAPKHVAALRGAAAAGDAAALDSTAHTLKGSGSYLGATRLRALCEQLEALGKAGTTDGADALVARVDDEVARVSARLEGERERWAA
jgi:PAS domain S-box-containing protein